MSVTFIHYLNGDLVRDDAEALVNTVNCVGVMGKGLALGFKQRFPAMFDAYRVACNRGEVRTGQMHLWDNPDADVWPGQPQLVVNFPTKQHWRNPSRMEWIESGLEDLADVIREQHLSTIAIPPLGCGLGGLAWNEVLRLIERILTERLADLDRHVEVRLYVP